MIVHIIISSDEKMRGQRGRLPVQPLGYVMSTKVIFRRAEVFVLAEVCLPRRPHAFWKDMMNIYSSAFLVRRYFLFSLRTWERGKTACGLPGRQTFDFRSSKNNFREHDISRPTPWDSLSVLSFSLGSEDDQEEKSVRQVNRGHLTQQILNG